MNPGTEQNHDQHAEAFPLLPDARCMHALQAPEGYFNTLTERMLEGVEAAGGAADASAIRLPVRPSALPAPAGYFEQLPEQITGQIFPKKNRTIRLSPLFKRARLAAAAALLVCAGIGLYRVARPAAIRNVTVAQLSAADVQAYETEYATDVSTTETSAEYAPLLAKVAPDDAALWLDESGAGEDAALTE